MNRLIALSLCLALIMPLDFLLESCRKDLSPVNSTMAGSFIATGSPQGDYWPTENWRRCSPEAVGMNTEKLKLAYDYAANPQLNTEAVVVVRNGYIVAEAYFSDFTINSRHESYSVAKSFSSALIGLAIDQGKIPSVNTPVYNYYPEWQTGQTQRAKRKITIRHLLTMTSGLQWNEEDYYQNTTTNDAFIMGSKYDFIQYVLDKPIVHEPGTYWYYSSGESMLLSGIIEVAAQKTAYHFAQENLFTPMGMAGVQWQHDPAGHTVTGWGVQATAREFAKFGYLYLRKGQWESKQLITQNWITESTSAASDTIDHYAYQWWLPPAYDNYKQYNIPEDTFIAVGIYVQLIFVVPSKNLVVVRLGNDSGGVWKSLEFLKIILDAIE